MKSHQKEQQVSWRRNLLNAINRPLNSLGVHLLPTADYRELRQTYNGMAWEKPAIAAEHLAHLKPTNPWLQQLRARYRNHPAAAHTQWNDEKLFERLRLEDFRGDNHYVYQTRYSPSPEKYYLTADYVFDNDRLELFGRLGEDGMFGAYTLPYDGGITISRDLLDSVNEINFICRMLDTATADGLRLLDVGAGYGRLAHRLAESFPATEIMCTDAVPTSTFLSEFYLRFRGVDDRATVIPLDEVEDALSGKRVDLITNIHSFSECQLSAIEWWFDVFERTEAQRLMIVPNLPDKFLSTEPDGSHQDFSPIIARHGWRLVHSEPIYNASEVAQKYALYPNFRFYWFERG